MEAINMEWHISKFIRTTFPTPVLYSEFERELIETMKKNKQILEINILEIKLEKHTLKTKFEVTLKDFKTFEWEGYLW